MPLDRAPGPSPGSEAAAPPRIPLGPTPKLPSSELERHREAHLLPPRAAGGWRDASPKAVRPVVFSGRRSCRGGVVDAAAKHGGCSNEEPFQVRSHSRPSKFGASLTPC